MRSKIMGLFFGIAMFLLTTVTVAHSKTDYTCQQIQDNYLDAVSQFVAVINDILGFDETNESKYADFKAALQDAITNIQNSGNATYPSLKASLGHIDDQKYPSSAADGLQQLKHQKKSVDDRVKEWKKANSTNPNDEPCRELMNCDLGESCPTSLQ